MEKRLYFPDVVRETGITERNIKFWVSTYRLAVSKEGRNTVFSPAIIDQLKLISELSATKMITSRLIAIILKQRSDLPLAADEKRDIQQLQEILGISTRRAAAARPITAPRRTRRLTRSEMPDEIL